MKKYTGLVLVLIIIGLLASVAFASPYDRGLSYYNKYQDARAVKIWREAARQGSTKAMVALGLLRWRGEILKKHEGKARIWFRRAALKGNSEGMIMLSVSLTDSIQIPRDYRRGLMWLLVAAATGERTREVTFRIRLLRKRMHPREIRGALRYYANYKETPQAPPRLKYEY